MALLRQCLLELRILQGDSDLAFAEPVRPAAGPPTLRQPSLPTNATFPTAKNNMPGEALKTRIPEPIGTI